MKKNLLLILCMLYFGKISFSQSITSVTPNNGNAGQSLTVSIVGQNVDFTQGSGTTVYLSQGSSTTIVAYNIMAMGPNSLTADISLPANAMNGAWDVNVSNSTFGTLTMFDGFTVNGPAITSVYPNSGIAGQSLTVSIVGQNVDFTQGSGTTVYLSDGQGSSTTIVAYNIMAMSPNSLMADISLPANAMSGTWDVNVSSSTFGTLTMFDGFTINSPAITSVYPNSGNAGQSLTVSIVGQNVDFTQGSGTTVYLSDGQGSSTTIVAYNVVVTGPNTLNADISIPANAANGSWDVSVYDSNGTLTMMDGFTIIAPELVSVTPNSGDPGQTLTVSIIGQNIDFTQGSGTTVYLSDGQGSSTTITAYNVIVIDANTINADIAIPLNAISGNWDLTVSDAGFGTLTKVNGFFVNFPLGTGKAPEKNAITAYPNPFTDEINLDYSLTNGADVKITLYSLLGNELKTISTKQDVKGNYSMKIKTSEFVNEQGIYLLKVSVNNDERIIKLTHLN